MRIKRIASTVVPMMLLLAVLIAIPQRQQLYDWWALRSYDPPTEIVELAQQTTMTELGRRIFYVTKPSINTASEFRSACTSAEQTIVLGCYKSGATAGIYLYDVTDERLHGVKQVTAAHEMLHAAYDRLSSKEQKRLDSLTTEAYSKLQDERIKKNVEAYRSRDASVVSNELHSILGSEVDNLSPELEAHYAKYFTNRKAIVAYSKLYESEFSKREELIVQYETQLKLLKAQIDTYKASLETLNTQLDQQKTNMDRLKSNGDIAGYNQQVSSYNSKVNQFNSITKQLKAAIEQHNDIVAKHNALVVEEKELYQSLDTRVPSTR